LKKQGFRIVACNYSCPVGELDLVAVDGSCIVFVEVRSTEKPDLERPTASVDRDKQRRLTQVALHFLQRHRLLGRAARFDVVIVSWPDGRREPRIVHYPGAFESIGQFQMFS
jgi:putative endonuclease